MSWKKWPYWLQVGAIGGALAALFTLSLGKDVLVWFIIGSLVGLIADFFTMPLWKPYWLHGGIVGGLVVLIFGFLLHNCVTWIIGIEYLCANILFHLGPVSSMCAVLIGFVVGALIGQKQKRTHR